MRAGVSFSVLVVGMLSGCAQQQMAEVLPMDGGTGTSKGPSVTAGAPGVIASTMAESLTAAGLDIKNLPDLKDVPEDKIIDVMMTFEKSLGATCTDCHVEDKSVDTPHKLIAAKMWDELVMKLDRADGSPLFCDSCHQGRLTFLDRSDDKALSTFMDTNYVDGVARKDGTKQSCTSCHGEPFNPNFLDDWGGLDDGGGSSDGGSTIGADAGVVDAGVVVDAAATPVDLATASTTCVPSVNEVQVQGSGGSSDEFIELFNPCAQAISLGGYSVVYRSAAGTSDTVLVKLDGQTLAASGYLVVGNTSYTGTATVKYSSNLANASGGVGLRASDGTLVDSLAWGSATNAFVEGRPASAPASGKSAQRSPDGSHAHADQSLDVVSAAPTPGAAN